MCRKALEFYVAQNSTHHLHKQVPIWWGWALRREAWAVCPGACPSWTSPWW